MAIRASAERPGAFLPRPSEALRITGEGGFGLLVLRVFLGFIFPTPCSWIRGRNRRNSETCAWRTCRGERLTEVGTLVAARFNPVIRAFYQRLRAAGKAKKVAL